MSKEFHESLWGCVNDFLSCGIVTFVPCGCNIIQSLAVAKVTGQDCITPYCLPILLGCIGSSINRGNIREALGVNGNFCTDLTVSCYCLPCSVCQEYREVKYNTRVKKDIS